MRFLTQRDFQVGIWAIPKRLPPNSEFPAASPKGFAREVNAAL
jgi:hypothetical protein